MEQSAKRVLIRLLTVIGLVGFLLVFGHVMERIKDSQKNNNVIYLDKGWTFTQNDKIVENVNLDGFKFDMANRGDHIIIFIELPNVKIQHPVLVLEQYHSLIDIYIDDEKIFQSGYKEKADNEAVGFGLYTASLPSDYMGKILTIEYHVEQDNSFPEIVPPVIENEINYISDYIKEYIGEVLTGIYLFIIGVVIILISIIRGKFSKEYRQFVEIGVIAISTGVWIASNHSAIKMIVDNLEIITYLEYVGGYVMILSITIFFLETNIRPGFKIVSKMCVTLYTLFIVQMVIAELFNLKHVTEDIGFFGIITNGNIVFAIITIIFGYKSRTKSEKIMTSSILAIAVTGGMELITFNLRKYYGINMPYTGFLLIGINIFMMMILNSYIVYIKEFVREDINKKILLKMAYSDQLTGLHNRVKCDEYLNKLDKQENVSYSIVNFDMNGLKKVNDELGHVEGDRYICEFAHILDTCFGGYGVVGRMGGDEFVAIIEGDYITIIEENINKMLEMINKENENNQRDYEISFAYGYAIKESRSTLKANEVYEIADKLMYECKKNQKKGRDMVFNGN